MKTTISILIGAAVALCNVATSAADLNAGAAKAKEVFQKVVSGGGWNAFGYIAAEADLARLK